MPSSASKAVLISDPQAQRQSPYFPYVWAILKSHAEREADLGGEIEWLDPIFRKNEPDALLEPYRHTPPDVLGLSCYTWNWKLQCQLAQRIKERNPRCLVVAGGPHPDYQDPEFFRKYPFIDVVAVKDGEVTFSKILRKVLEAETDYTDIGGLYLPGGELDGHACTGPAEVPSRFDYSPYIEQSAYLEKISERYGPEGLSAIWETNRGCPYSCSFCDWGSNTMSKVRTFDMARVTAEIEWFARMKIKTILLADANFGILSRDLEIADLLNHALARHGYPRFVHYSPAKNNPDRTVELARKFHKSGISPVHPFAVQHTDLGVLAAADRANISVDKQRRVAKEVISLEIPTLVQLILGIPGDTYDLWKTCLTDLMDWGLHDNYQVFDYALLPNAPAAERTVRERWEIETISRELTQVGSGQRRKDDVDALTRVDLIVQCKSFTRDDWVRMKIYCDFVGALHNRSLTRLIAMYLHFSHRVSYREFYDQLIEDFFAASRLYRRLDEHFHVFLREEGATIDLELEQFPQCQVYFSSSQWAFIQICRDFDKVFTEMKRFLLARFPEATNLASAIDYQRNVVILPGYDRDAGKTFPTDFDWITYFDEVGRLTRHEPRGEPEATPGALVHVSDDGSELDWASRGSTGRWLRWIDLIREVRRTLNTNFQAVRLERKTRPLRRAIGLG